jgi:hypothetical protein
MIGNLFSLLSTQLKRRFSVVCFCVDPIVYVKEYCYIVITCFLVHDDVLSYGSENKLFLFFIFLCLFSRMCENVLPARRRGGCVTSE